MKVFQLTLCGWDGSTSVQDHLVKWVKSPSREALDKFIAQNNLSVEGHIDDDLDPAYTLASGVDVLIDENGHVSEGNIGRITPE